MEELVALDKPIEATVEGVAFECDRIRASDKIEKEPAVLLIDGIAKLTKGNISAVEGIAKSKKTFGLTLMMSCIARGESVVPKFLPVGSGKLAWIDTEQSKSDAHKVVKRIEYMAGGDEGLLFFGMKQYAAKERLSKTEAMLEKYGSEIDVLVIDGIRDFVRDFNNPIESSDMVALLMKWTVDFDMHICVVLHANKSDGNMRGHLGTELENKSETVFKIAKMDNMKDTSEVSEKFGRGKNIEPFMFTINDRGMPELIEGDGIDTDDAPY